jgi:hypothetical protein
MRLLAADRSGAGGFLFMQQLFHTPQSHNFEIQNVRGNRMSATSFFRIDSVGPRNKTYSISNKTVSLTGFGFLKAGLE